MQAVQGNGVSAVRLPPPQGSGPYPPAVFGDPGPLRAVHSLPLLGQVAVGAYPADGLIDDHLDDALGIALGRGSEQHMFSYCLVYVVRVAPVVKAREPVSVKPAGSNAVRNRGMPLPNTTG